MYSNNAYIDRAAPFLVVGNLVPMTFSLAWGPVQGKGPGNEVAWSTETTIVMGRICKCITHPIVNFRPTTWRAWLQFFETSKVESDHFGGSFVSLLAVNMQHFANGLLLTRRWKLREVFKTVVMYRPQQRGGQGQRIDTSHSQEISRGY